MKRLNSQQKKKLPVFPSSIHMLAIIFLTSITQLVTLVILKGKCFGTLLIVAGYTSAFQIQQWSKAHTSKSLSGLCFNLLLGLKQKTNNSIIEACFIYLSTLYTVSFTPLWMAGCVTPKCNCSHCHMYVLPRAQHVFTNHGSIKTAGRTYARRNKNSQCSLM